MDCYRVGRLILAIRKEKEMTQNQFIKTMNISNNTTPKWKRVLGCLEKRCNQYGLGVHEE